MARTLLAISRPRFWLYLGGTYLVGYAAGAGAWADYANPGFWLALAYFLVPANLFLYGVNDLFDEDTDRHNRKKGDREHRLLSAEKRGVALASVFSAALGLALLPWLPAAARACLLGFLALGAAYSAPPLRLKTRPFLDFPSNLLYALPGFLGYIQASGQSPPGLALLGAWCWTGAMHLFSAVPDIAADREAGLATTATVLGERRALALCALLWLLAAWAALALLPSPLAILACAYPLAAALLVWRPGGVARAYWWFPLANGLAGFLLFLLAARP